MTDAEHGGDGLALYTRIIRRLTSRTRAWDAAMETIAVMDRHAAILRAERDAARAKRDEALAALARVDLECAQILREGVGALGTSAQCYVRGERAAVARIQKVKRGDTHG